MTTGAAIFLVTLLCRMERTEDLAPVEVEVVVLVVVWVADMETVVTTGVVVSIELIGLCVVVVVVGKYASVGNGKIACSCCRIPEFVVFRGVVPSET